ncbi:MAG: Nif3-like dinuclear metal center hexameric protein [Patescibacteria group bacterium]|nr:Nif3-like dinuclear metal center hexameric protein [Patescibacteria group bacterium]
MRKQLKKFELDLRKTIENDNASFEWRGFVYTNKKTENVENVSFALDLSISNVKEAIKNEADILLCFHSSNELDLETKNHMEIKRLLDKSRLSIYKCHLPINFSPVGIHYQVCKILDVDFVSEKFLLDSEEIEGGVYRILGQYTINEMLNRLKNLKPISIKMFNYDLEKKYSNILFASGSGCKKEILNQLDCDLFISGEIKHGSIVQAQDLDIALLEIGHYVSEAIPLENFSKHFSDETNYKTDFINSAPKEKVSCNLE